MDAAEVIGWGVLLAVVGRQPLNLLAMRSVGWVLERTAPSTTVRIAERMRRLPHAGWRHYGLAWLARASCDVGQTGDGIQAIEELLDAFRHSECPWSLVNTATDLYVNAGRYREALRIPTRWSKVARTAGRKRDELAFALTRINQAEALHNLGDDERALDRLAAVERLVHGSPYALSGLHCLRAWVLVHRGKLRRAREELGKVQLKTLKDYEAEVLFTWAALERESGNLERALEQAELGRAHAGRASSQRNGKFMVASILALMKLDERALAMFRAAVDCSYTAQAGDGLLRFGSFLERKRDFEAARRVYRLVLERDRESIAATRAREAIERLEPSTTAHESV